MTNRSGIASAQVVSTWQLSNVVRAWLHKANGERDWDYERSAARMGTHPPPFTPLSRLAFETGLTPRQIYRVVKCETKTTGLDVADKLLTVIGRTDALTPDENGEVEIEVMKNPVWSMENYQAYMRERGCV